MRDGRAVLNSYLKETYSIVVKDETTGVLKSVRYPRKPTEPLRAIRSWRNGNLKTLFFLKAFEKGQYLTVRHEDFCRDPNRVLAKIGSFAAFDFEESMLRIGESENHIFGGNSSRINAKEIRAVEEGWRSNLVPKVLSQFRWRAGLLNRYFGYCDK